MNANEYLVTDAMVKDHMKTELLAYPDVYRDSAGEINMTALAEDAADFYNEYEDGTEAEPNGRMFDLAFEIANEDEQAQEEDGEEEDEGDAPGYCDGCYRPIAHGSLCPACEADYQDAK